MKAKTGIPTIATNGTNHFLMTFKDDKNGALGFRHIVWNQWLANHPEERPVPAVKLRLKCKQP